MPESQIPSLFEVSNNEQPGKPSVTKDAWSTTFVEYYLTNVDKDAAELPDGVKMARDASLTYVNFKYGIRLPVSDAD